MKELKEILQGVKIINVRVANNDPVTGITLDSRAVEKGFLFAAIKGALNDGHSYIGKAIADGAKHIILEELPAELEPGINYIKVENSSETLAWIASSYYGNPSSDLILVGVTGTNGKTTIATLLCHLFNEMGHKSGLISTIRILSADTIINATHTTPDSVKLNKLLRNMVNEGCKYCFMEVSSHSVVQHRVTGLVFKAGIFTNLTRDHLDYHGTFQNYIQAKKQFFDLLKTGSFAVMNGDDKHNEFLTQNTTAKVVKYSLKNPSDFKAKILESDISGLHLLMDGNDFYTNKAGKFNAYNLLAVYSTAVVLGSERQKVLEILSKPVTVDGRFEIIPGKNEITGIVDYAHTPDALENVLKTIVDCRKKGRRIITVFGCGGNRDKGKRPIMGRISAEYSDLTIVTTDNPRFEEPQSIINEILTGIEKDEMKNVLNIPDREQAIKTACSIAMPGDIILVAGKGHETYQEVKGIRSAFDDRTILTKYIREE